LKAKYFYGYNIVAAGFVTQAVCVGAMFTYGVFFAELQAAFGWSRAMISGASSLAFLIMGGGAVLAGGLNDHIGPRIILAISAVATGTGYLLLAGIQSLFTVISPTIAELFGTDSHGLLFGLVLFSGTLGGAAGPLLAGFLFDHTGTYRIGFTVLVLMSILGVFLVTVLRPLEMASNMWDRQL
jgi:MFS family permease